MKKLLVLALLLTAVSCAGTPDDPDAHVDWPEIPYVPPILEKHILRRSPEFQFRDEEQKKHFFIFVTLEPGFEEEVVTVQDLGSNKGERLATLDEFDTAMSVFQKRWKDQGLRDRLEYHNRLHAAEQNRNQGALDTMIRLKKSARKELENKKFDIDADLRARTDTGDDKDKDHMAFLQNESDRLLYQLTIRTAELKILEHKAWMRARRSSR